MISWQQSPSAVILEHKKIKFAIVSTNSQSICHEVMGLAAFSLSSSPLIKTLFNSSLLSAIRVVSYLRFLMFLLAILIPACASSTLAFHMMYSAYRVYSFPNLKPVYCFMCNCCFLTCIQVSQEACKWSGILISFRIFQFVVIHTVNM